MTDYITREAAKRKHCAICMEKHICYRKPTCNELKAFDLIQAADARPVVRGRWIERRFSEHVYGETCSVCHTTWDYGTNYCPSCGANMSPPPEEGET